MVATTDESSGSSAVTRVTSQPVNRPRTVVQTSWPIEKSIVECAGSDFHVPVT